jgi:flagellar motor switch protein FliN/FliY
MAGDAEPIGQDEIENLLRQAQEAAGQFEPAPPARGEPAAEASEMQTVSTAPRPTAPASAGNAPARQTSAGAMGDDISFLLQQAEAAIASVDEPVDPALDGIAPFQFRDFAGTPASGEKATLELLKDVDLDLRIELGRTHMHLEDVLRLKRGSVVPLDKLAGDPVDIHVNGRLIARGEVLVLNDNFCVRVAELLSGDEA